ncbi:MAG TPA: PilN domain-containing protein [bacterium]|jgi:Tfp pilus assembly protein PilN
MIRINLLPREQVRRAGPAPRAVTLLAAAVVLAAMVASTLYFNGRNARVRDEIARTEAQITALTPEVERVEALRREIDTARRKQQLLQRLESARVPWDTVLEGVRTLMPKDVWLSQIAAGEDGSMNFIGYGLTYTAVAQFMVNLEDSPMFADVDLVLGQKQPVGGKQVVNFSIVGKLTLARKEAVLR